MNIIIPLCGIGKRFTDAGYNEPKPLIKIFNKRMIECVIDCLKLNNEDKLFIIYHTTLDDYNFNNILKDKYKNIIFIPITTRTKGAAETILFGLDYIINNKINISNECLLLDCDTIYNTDIIKKIKKQNRNSVIYFEDLDSNPIYSYIQMDNTTKIIDIIEKEQISKNANTGAYFFKDIFELRNGCKYVISNNITFKDEYYTSCVIKYMINNSIDFYGIKIKKEYYKSLGTPQDLQAYDKNQYAFLFDLDGTLVKTDTIYYKVWREILLQYNIILTRDIFNNCIQGNTDTYALEKLKIYNIDNTNISEIKNKLFNKYISEILIIDGVYDFIKKIHKLGYFIAIVTNCNRETCMSILEHIKINKFIDFIVIGNECSKPKPYSDPYLKAINYFNISHNNSIIFEDSKPGLISALGILPKKIIGVNNGDNLLILDELNINNRIDNFNNLNIDDILQENKYDVSIILNDMIYNSLKNKYDIKKINIDLTKLKGGYISDVIKVSIELTSGKILDCVLKYENDYTSSLTKMAYQLGLFDREYYFYESISPYININIPKYIGTIKDKNFISKGLLLENIDNKDMQLGLDLNKENIDVSLKVIEESAKFHSLFWNKDLTKSFINLKKHNDKLFNPLWGNFIRSRWPLFIEKWNHILTDKVKAKMQYIVDNFDSIQEYLSNDNLTLCHGDVKSGNIFYQKNKNIYTPYFIDWQYIANGKGVQDIVFFIIESFSIENINKYMDIFKKYYYIKLQEYGITYYNLEQYNKDFEYSIYYFPFFVAIWFGTTPTDELIDVTFPEIFISKLIYIIHNY